jgi:hypothetical protein
MDKVDFGGIVTAVAFSDLQNGVVPFVDNVIGPGVKYTNNGGQLWKMGTITKYASLLMDASAAGTNAVIGGTMDTMYSQNGGSTFNSSRIEPKGNTVVGQNAETIVGRQDTKFFGLCGQDLRGNLNGVAISTDGGENFTFINITQAVALARYAAYPSRNVWFMTTGDFASLHVNDDPTLVKRISNTISIHKTSEGHLRYRASRPDERRTGATPTPAPSDWYGEILKTSDAGKTWTLQYSTSDFYFNGIDCTSETRCCAVGESQNPSAAPGARIWCTSDGSTWTQVVFMAGQSNSLIAIRAVSDLEWWAGGGYMQPKTFDANFPHTTDGWKTYTNNTLPHVFINDLDMIDANHGWASTFDVSGVSGLAKYS